MHVGGGMCDGVFATRGYAMIVSMIAALAMAQAIQTNAYQLEIVMIEDGHESLTTRTQVVVDESSHALVGDVELNARLYTVQGDGDGATLQLEAVVTRNGETVIEPNLTVVRGEPFYFQSGSAIPKAVRVILTPLD